MSRRPLQIVLAVLLLLQSNLGLLHLYGHHFAHSQSLVSWFGLSAANKEAGTAELGQGNLAQHSDGECAICSWVIHASSILPPGGMQAPVGCGTQLSHGDLFSAFVSLALVHVSSRAPPVSA